MARRIVPVLSIVLVAAGLMAGARAEQVRDNKDVRGPFDIRLFGQDRRDGNRLRFKLLTHERWTVEDVRRGGFAIRVDSDRDQNYDRFVLIEYKERRRGAYLQATVTKPDGEVVDRARARHREPRRLTVWLDRRVLGIAKGSFRVNAYSVLYGGECGDEGCRDPVPDQGLMRVAFGGLCGSREPDITGTSGPDRFETTGKRVVIAGLGGDDVVKVTWGSVIACGGGGADLLVGGGRTDVLFGGAGDDELRLKGTRDRANRGYGGFGNDLLYGGSGSDRLFGQGGSDHLAGHGGDDHLDGGAGRDDADGGRGNDTCVNARRIRGC